MSDVTTSAPSQVPELERLAVGERRPARNLAMLAFVTISLFMGMLVQQTTAIERGSWQYFVYTALALALPLCGLREISNALFDRCKLLLLFLVWAGCWQLCVGDGRAAAQLLLLVLVTTWVATDQARLEVHDLTRLYLALIAAGVIVLNFTDFNPYSLIPGRAIPDFGVWRVSFFPNIAYSGMLSLTLLLILTSDMKMGRARPVLIAIATYFLVFSFVRAAFVAGFMYLLLRFWFSRWPNPRPKRMFWISLCVASGFVLATAISANVLYQVQDYPWVSAMLLRGETNLTVDQIAYQLYRPWLWSEQLNLFASSPWLMGWGSTDFYGLVAKTVENPDTMLISGGTEALPTRLLVVYGLPGLLFTIYLVTRLRKLALEDDRWACACFPPLFSLMMTWGSLFHPSDAVCVILLLIMTKGAKGFTNAAIESAPEVEAETSGPAAAVPAE
jgi:hypothetical protein